MCPSSADARAGPSSDSLSQFPTSADVVNREKSPGVKSLCPALNTWTARSTPGSGPSSAFGE